MNNNALAVIAGLMIMVLAVLNSTNQEARFYTSYALADVGFIVIGLGLFTEKLE